LSENEYVKEGTASTKHTKTIEVICNFP